MLELCFCHHLIKVSSGLCDEYYLAVYSGKGRLCAVVDV
jgi:hypothetical protein